MIIIDKEKCIGCGACVPDCFTRYISLVDGKVEPTGRVCMSCGHCTAVCPTKAITLEGADESEIMEYDKDKFFVDKDNFMNYLKFRRSVRQFEQREVDPKLLAKVLEAGRYTPTGSNYQNVRYIVTSLETTKKLKQMTADFLGNIGATKCMLDYQNVRIWKDLTNNMNRAINCDTANKKRTQKASESQIEAIEKIARTIGLDTLESGLKEIAYLRVQYPDISLSELSSEMAEPISRSGINHRLKKLVEIADSIKEKE